MRSTDTNPEETGDLLTKTSERVVKKLTLESLATITELNETMPSNVQDSAMMICYRECLSNLEKFDGDNEKKVLQFINNIERIGKMIDANDDVLHCMCTAKLGGEAKRWYEDNVSLIHWEDLKPALLERFTMSDSSSKIFEQLKERKQKPDETITSYYDAIIKLCREYDSLMSQKMMISWLENGIKDSLKIQVKRQMKLLSESARTTQAFLKIAKDEQELQEENLPTSNLATSYVPYFTNTVSTTLQANDMADASKYPHPARTNTSHQYKNTYQHQGKFNATQRSPSRNYQQSSQQHSFTFRSQPLTARRNTLRTPLENSTTIKSMDTSTRQSNPCYICQRNNHRSIDCYYKKPHGCYKCEQSDHRIRDCPAVFY